MTIELRNITGTPIFLQPVEGAEGYWSAMDSFVIRLETNQGNIILHGEKGWITDKRSGSSAVDGFIPKWKGPQSMYSRIIAAHDIMWSGWITRALSDELLRQGIILSGVAGPVKAGIVKFAVDHFGHYYELEEPLTGIYAGNRQKELVYWEA